jgi:protocatechuate 3,4-dioxygenase beta subunit
VVKVSGQIRYADLSPVQNATIDIWHNNSESNPSKFDYEGTLTTDLEGNYSLETDFPEKHFEDVYAKMRRIYFKIKGQNGKKNLTKTLFWHGR